MKAMESNIGAYDIYIAYRLEKFAIESGRVVKALRRLAGKLTGD